MDFSRKLHNLVAMVTSADKVTVSVSESPKKKNRCSCCCCCCTVTLLVIVAIVAAFCAAFFSTTPATEFTNVEFTAKDGITKLHAYLAKPSAMGATDKAPAAIVFHAWNGMSEEPVYFADRLAEQGYVAIAPDLFRNVASAETNLVRNIFNVITAPQARMNEDADAALAYLTALPEVNTSHIVSGPGFCFGGTQSLVFAARHPVAATVTCYGTWISELANASSTAWGELGQTPVLGIYGALDTRPSPAEAEAFRAALSERNVEHNVSIYAGVGHAFVTPHAHEDATDPTHSQAVSAWSQVTDFLAAVRRTGGASSGRRARALADAVQHGAQSSDHDHAHANDHDESLLARVRCALKCALDVLRGTGHWQHVPLPTFGLEKLLERL